MRDLLYLGILSQTGLNARQAIEPVRICVSLASPEMIKVLVFPVLADRGDPDGIRLRNQHMSKRHYKIVKDFDSSIFSMVVDSIAGTLKWLDSKNPTVGLFKW